MRRIVICAFLAASIAPQAIVAAQDDAREDDRRPEGIWLPEPIMRNMLNMFADQTAKELGLDEFQRSLTREAVQTRVLPWLQENRNEIMELTNFHLLWTTADEPPTPEQVAEWAERMKPLVGDFNAVVGDVTDEMRGFMTDEQIVKLDAGQMMWNVGMGFLEQRLNVWSEGGFDPERDWPKGVKYRDAEKEREKALMSELDAAQKKTLQEALGDRKPINKQDPWEQEVEAFIKRYELDDAQARKARDILKTAIQRRDQYLTPEREAKISSLEHAIAGAKEEKEREAYVKEYSEIAVAVENIRQAMFDRLNKLPTTAQRRAAAQKDAAGKTEKTE